MEMILLKQYIYILWELFHRLNDLYRYQFKKILFQFISIITAKGKIIRLLNVCVWKV